MKLTVIIPARDEEDVIEETINGLIPIVKKLETEILIVNDHSIDKTSKIVEDIGKKHSFVKKIDNHRESGFANALKTGFESATGKFVVPFMADSCDDPSTLPKMLEKADKGFDLVCGSRYIRGGKKIGGPLVQGFFSRIVGLSLNIFTGIPTKDEGNAYKMYRRDLLLSFPLKQKGFAISMEACVNFFLSGYKICDVPTVWTGRKKGKSKFKLSKTLPYAQLYFYTIWKKWISRL